jgi:hypothetical protein
MIVILMPTFLSYLYLPLGDSSVFNLPLIREKVNKEHQLPLVVVIPHLLGTTLIRNLLFLQHHKRQGGYLRLRSPRHLKPGDSLRLGPILI